LLHSSLSVSLLHFIFSWLLHFSLSVQLLHFIVAFHRFNVACSWLQWHNKTAQLYARAGQPNWFNALDKPKVWFSMKNCPLNWEQICFNLYQNILYKNIVYSDTLCVKMLSLLVLNFMYIGIENENNNYNSIIMILWLMLLVCCHINVIN